MGYDSKCLVDAYWDVLNIGLKVTAAAAKHRVPRKTLEYYVKGKATAESYQKIGLPMPNEIYPDHGGSFCQTEYGNAEQGSSGRQFGDVGVMF